MAVALACSAIDALGANAPAASRLIRRSDGSRWILRWGYQSFPGHSPSRRPFVRRVFAARDGFDSRWGYQIFFLLSDRRENIEN
jgi:hypothetical protein